jgi:hypothetical protein
MRHDLPPLRSTLLTSNAARPLPRAQTSGNATKEDEPIAANIPGLRFNGHEVGDGEVARRSASLGQKGAEMMPGRQATLSQGNRSTAAAV